MTDFSTGKLMNRAADLRAWIREQVSNQEVYCLGDGRWRKVAPYFIWPEGRVKEVYRRLTVAISAKGREDDRQITLRNAIAEAEQLKIDTEANDDKF